MKIFIGLAAIATASYTMVMPATAQQRPQSQQSMQDEEARLNAAQTRFDNELRIYQDAIARYRDSVRRNDWRDNRPGGWGSYDPRDDEFYDPARDYRSGNYRERVLTEDDRIYRGQDGRYYCKRNDGTTGLIVGAAAGGLFGNVIAGGRSRTLGTLLGAVAGGALGNSAERNQANRQDVRCR